MVMPGNGPPRQPSRRCRAPALAFGAHLVERAHDLAHGHQRTVVAALPEAREQRLQRGRRVFPFAIEDDERGAELAEADDLVSETPRAIVEVPVLGVAPE